MSDEWNEYDNYDPYDAIPFGDAQRFEDLQVQADMDAMGSPFDPDLEYRDGYPICFLCGEPVYDDTRDWHLDCEGE